MAYTAKQQSFFDAEASRYMLENGLTWTGQSVKRNWTVEDRQAYIRHMAAFIEANPQIFDPAQVDAAIKVKEIQFSPELPTGVLSMVAEFFGEMGNQAERINPFSLENKALLWGLAGLGIVVFAGVFAWNISPKNVTGK